MMRKVLNILKKSNLLSFLLFLQFISYARGEVIARLVKYEGRVYFKRLGMNTFAEQAKIGSAIRNGDEMKVDNKSFAAVIYIDDRSILKIRENTKFSFMDTRNSRTIDIKHGTILNDIKKEKRKKENLKVRVMIKNSLSMRTLKSMQMKLRLMRVFKRKDLIITKIMKRKNLNLLKLPENHFQWVLA